MAYTKLNLANGQKLTADHLAYLETGIDTAHVTAETIDVGVTSINGQTGDVTIAGGGGVSFTETPPGSGIYEFSGTTITETTPGSGIYEIGA